MAKRLSENGKVVLFCILFPIMWPFLPVILVCIVVESIANAYYDWRYYRTKDQSHE